MKLSNQFFMKYADGKILIREDVKRLCKSWNQICGDCGLFTYTFYFPFPDVSYQVGIKEIQNDYETLEVKLEIDSLKADTGDVLKVDTSFFTISTSHSEPDNLYRSIILLIEASLWDDYKYSLTDSDDNVIYTESGLRIYSPSLNMMHIDKRVSEMIYL